MYPALPDRRMAYDIDGTVVYKGTTASGPTNIESDADLLVANGNAVTTGGIGTIGGVVSKTEWVFFPEQREVTGFFAKVFGGWAVTMQGSNDTTNGLDGTWETATMISPVFVNDYSFRSGIVAVSFTGPKRVIRVVTPSGNSYTDPVYNQFHLYGEKAAGETPDDIVFINHQDTPGVEYAAPQDFGDRPLGTSVVHQFRIKNVSPTLTANSINLQCNDSDFAISTDGTTWVVTINIASLAAGAESATLYVRNTSPAPGAPLGPRAARIVATVGSWA